MSFDMGFFSDNRTVLSLAAYYVGSAAISSLPVPEDHSSEFYKWFYKFANTVAANASALRGKAQYEPKPPKQDQGGQP